MAMRWERVEANGGDGPGVRWGHTCNAIEGRVYLFGGYGEDEQQTNQIDVLDTVNRVWSRPTVKGMAPAPRDSHSCTTVEDNLLVFGGVRGKKPLNDLHVFETSSNTWILPTINGLAPTPISNHAAVLVGKKVFIFGGCGVNSKKYNDLYSLDTEARVWAWHHVVPTGTLPGRRDSHTCTAWQHLIMVVGGHDSRNACLSDFHVLDTDTLVWYMLNPTGQILPPRAGHTTVCLESDLVVFGGFSDDILMHGDLYVLDLETGVWNRALVIGQGPCNRFSMAGERLDPQTSGMLVYYGGFSEIQTTLGDLYYLKADYDNVDSVIHKNIINGHMYFDSREAELFNDPEHVEPGNALRFTVCDPFFLTSSVDYRAYEVMFTRLGIYNLMELEGIDWKMYSRAVFIRRVDGSKYVLLQ
ncbi:hypothetical protein AAHA92_31831 [Salvia divinorum]|uniref:Uncharacterized protein n=1 Tax=Salvia divinorum TaxID=28513 RepID=A0ABD1FIQ0_SALDI